MLLIRIKTIEDKALLDKGDIIAIYQRQVKTVYRLCYSYLKTSQDAEDAVQNVFIKLMSYDKDFSDHEHEKAWLLTCAANHCKDILKSAYRKRTDFDLLDDKIASCDPESDDSRVYEALLALPDKYKDCVYLHYYEGYKTDEIAAMINKPASTIRNHLREARQLLKKQLGGDEDE